MSDTIRVFKDSAGEYRWTKVAANGEPVATSESYTTKASALIAAEREANGTDAQVAVDEGLTPEFIEAQGGDPDVGGGSHG